MKTSVPYGIVACSKTRVRCVFCGVYIPKANKCIEEHTNGQKHRENMLLMGENGISLKNDDLYCKLCNVTLSDEESVTKHTENESHANWMAAVEEICDGEFIVLDKYLSCEKDAIYCDVCKCDISPDLVTIEQHVNGYNHRANVVERLKPLNGIFPVENGDEVWCKVCDLYISNSLQSILGHIDDDEEHMDWFMEVEDLIEEQDITIQDYLHNEHEFNAYCNKCQTEITCNPRCIEEHVTSSIHMQHGTDS